MNLQILFLSCFFCVIVESTHINFSDIADSTSKYLPCKITLSPDSSEATIENGFIKATVSTKQALEISDISADFFGEGSFQTDSVLQKPIRVFAHWVPGSVPQSLPAVANISVETSSPFMARIVSHARLVGIGSPYEDVDVSATFTISLGRGQVPYLDRADFSALPPARPPSLPSALPPPLRPSLRPSAASPSVPPPVSLHLAPRHLLRGQAHAPPA